jgi:predicted nuclease of predicted toxin-antitoxin system
VWLLDANVDIRISEVLAGLGISSRTTESQGWKPLSNGNLVSVAVAKGFTCLVTRDQLFTESAARSLRLFPQFAIVVLQLGQCKRSQYLAQFRQAWVIEPIVPIPGKSIGWPTD